MIKGDENLSNDDGRNGGRKEEMTEGQDKSSIAPFFAKRGFYNNKKDNNKILTTLY